jgi:hypothetical protein
MCKNLNTKEIFMAETTTDNLKKPIFDRLIQTYDQEIVNNPEWLSVSDCEKIIGMGDRTVRNYAKAGKWNKKYAKVDGSPMVYFAKVDVEAYLKANGLIKPDEAELKAHESTPGSQEQKPLEQAPNTLEKPLDPLTFPKELSLRVESALTVHKEALNRLHATEDKLVKSEQSRVTWKINAFWAIGIAVLSAGTLGYLLFNSSRVSSELSKNYNNLSARYEDTQDELLKAKEAMLEKDDLLMKVQKNTQVINATGN